MKAGWIFLALLIGAAPPGGAQRPDPMALYRAGEYQLAYEGFRALIAQRGADPVLLYDAGLALYKMGRFDEAETPFLGATAPGGALAQRAWYNLGTTYLQAAATRADRIGTLRQAVTAFARALSLDPHDSDARWNLEVAEHRLGEAALAMSPGPTRRTDWGAGNLTKSGYGGQEVTTARAGGGAGSGAGLSAPRLTPEQARRLLNEFRAQQERHPDTPRVSASPSGTDRKEW
jgi:tetratricopeptide (TPR) repeat protein